MSLCLTPAIERITAAVTGRARSLFDDDLARHADGLRDALSGRRVLVAGGAGSIGAATILELLDCDPAALAVLDPSENNLAELLRTVRSRERVFRGEFSVAPLDYGSPLARRWLGSQSPFDWVLSFAALKHVRSERDAVSVLRMLEVNLLAADRFLGVLRAQGHGQRGVFTVSTDKAATPVSLMGASKRALELLLWAHGTNTSATSGGGDAAPLVRATTARFANVAFSDGSLPWGFLQRLAKGQPLAAPGDVRRYLVSPREAGQLCLVATALAPDRRVLVPRLLPERDLTDFVRVAEATLREHGLQPSYYESEDEARGAVERDRRAGRYPVLVTRSDTSGEKDEEIFVAKGETAEECGLDAALVVPAPTSLPDEALAALLTLIEDGCERGLPVSKPSITEALSRVVPELVHHDTGKSLDAKM